MLAIFANAATKQGLLALRKRRLGCSENKSVSNTPTAQGRTRVRPTFNTLPLALQYAYRTNWATRIVSLGLRVCVCILALM